MSSTIMLAKSFDIKHLEFPVEVTLKLDGIAADFYKETGEWKVRSRQDKPINSVSHILEWLNSNLSTTADGTHIIGELTVIGIPSFKEAGGIIRRDAANPCIVLNAYDYYEEGEEDTCFLHRKATLIRLLDANNTKCNYKGVVYDVIDIVPMVAMCHEAADLSKIKSRVLTSMGEYPLYEGVVIRSMMGKHSGYKVGKRSHGMMKFKPKPTLDLQVVQFHEATANKTMTFLGEEFQEGEGLRAVGRLEVAYNGTEIGVGPGCLTHEERRQLWEEYSNYGLREIMLIAEVEYMLDASYDALRQPVFKRWRYDKTEPSEAA